MNTIFFPRKDFDVEICNHRHDKKMTYVEQTDELDLSAADIILSKALSRSLRVGGFIGQHAQTLPLSTYIQNRISDSTLRCDYYFPPKNSADSGIEYTEEEFDALYENNRQWFYNLMNRNPSCLSYGYGITNYSTFAKKYFLAGRNSGYYSTYDYGKSFNGSFLGSPNQAYTLDNWINHYASFRWYDNAKTVGVEASLQSLSDVIDVAYASSGMVHNFTHWHQMRSDTTGLLGYDVYDTYFDMLVAKNVNNDIHFCSFGEAVEYMVFRSMISKAVMYRPKNDLSKLIIRMESLNSINVNPILNTPISVKVDLSMTHLAEKIVRCKGGTIYNQTGNIVIVEIPYSEFSGAILY